MMQENIYLMNRKVRKLASESLLVNCAGKAMVRVCLTYPLSHHIENENFEWTPKCLTTVIEQDISGTQAEYFDRIIQKYAGRICNGNVLDWFVDHYPLLPWEPSKEVRVIIGDRFTSMGHLGLHSCRGFYYPFRSVDSFKIKEFAFSSKWGFTRHHPPPPVVVFTKQNY
jgi:hypothetical protein